MTEAAMLATRPDLDAAIAKLEARLMRWQIINSGVIIGVLGLLHYSSPSP